MPSMFDLQGRLQCLVLHSAATAAVLAILVALGSFYINAIVCVIQKFLRHNVGPAP